MGEGSGATSVGCMGGWIHTGLRGTLAGDLNNCRGWDGGIGLVATSCMPTGAVLSMLIISKVGTGAFPSVSTPSIPLGSSMQCVGPLSWWFEDQFLNMCTENRYQVRNPPQPRTSQELYESILEWKIKPSSAQRKEYAMMMGISRESPLWRLYRLHGFDILHDLVFDVMYVMCFRVFKNYMLELFRNIISTGCTTDVEMICDAVAKSRPHELRSGRWPYRAVEMHSCYKAEENKLFMQWILPHILKKCHGTISSRLHKLELLLIDIEHHFFNYSRVKGWTIEEMHIVQRLFQHWRVISEELLGPNGRPLEHVVRAGHLLQDIRRFGHSDVSW
jgi:hypothetical protein